MHPNGSCTFHFRYIRELLEQSTVSERLPSKDGRSNANASDANQDVQHSRRNEKAEEARGESVELTGDHSKRADKLTHCEAEAGQWREITFFSVYNGLVGAPFSRMVAHSASNDPPLVRYAAAPASRIAEAVFSSS
jgi:hypothetical protein